MKAAHYKVGVDNKNKKVRVLGDAEIPVVGWGHISLKPCKNVRVVDIPIFVLAHRKWYMHRIYFARYWGLMRWQYQEVFSEGSTELSQLLEASFGKDSPSTRAFLEGRTLRVL